VQRLRRRRTLVYFRNQKRLYHVAGCASIGDIEDPIPREVTQCRRLAADNLLRLWPGSGAGNSVRNDDAELLDQVDDPHAPPPSDAPAGEPDPRLTMAFPLPYGGAVQSNESLHNKMR
jgi:hypothetical protein